MLPPPDRPPGKAPLAGIGRMEMAALALVMALCGWLYFGNEMRDPSSCFSRTPSGYYGLLTAGFRAGHLYAAIEPQPALLALKDPYDPVANAPYRVHDMTLWKGKYYLYFGVTPVLILFWPVAALTGYYPTEPFAVAFFSYGGFCAAVMLLLAIRRRHYPDSPRWVVVAGALALAFANPVAGLTQGSQFYQVPIACAFCLQMLMLGAIYRALHAPRRPMLWLAAASVLFGLAVGARPNYVLGGLALFVPVGWLLRPRVAHQPLRLGRSICVLAAAFGPAILCGCGLLLYNWLRFGSATEFGMHYQLAGVKVTTLQPLAAGNFLPHLREYLFNKGSWSPYFPFFIPPSGVALGLLRYFPWLWLAPFALCWRIKGSRSEDEGRFALALVIAVGILATLGLLSCFFGTTTERYPSDFAPAWLLLGGIGALALIQWAGKRPVWKQMVTTVCVAAIAISVSVGLAVIFKAWPQEGFLGAVARAGNWPAYAWQRAHGQEYGALRLAVELPADRAGFREPLFQTGLTRNERDWLFIEYLHDGRARIGFYHAGLGELPGAEFEIPADRRLVVETQCSSLLPPLAYPVFNGWTRADFETMRRDLVVKVNGVETVRAVLDCYESTPAALEIGAMDRPDGGISARFTGRVMAASRLPLVRPEMAVTRLQEALPIELTLFLPADRKSRSDPLLVTGTGSQSDLLYCIYDDSNRVKFALDHFGSGGPESEWLPYDPLRPHTLTLWMGSLAGAGTTGGPETDPSWRQRLVVLFDGHQALNLEQLFYPATPATATVGRNTQGATLAGPRFWGRVLGWRTVPFETLPALNKTGEYGAVEMNVVFPLGAQGRADPLVVTGPTGAADLIYVKYLDSRHVSFGFDHWGVGGLTGPPVEMNDGSHRLELTMGSLYSDSGPPDLATRVQVRLDGKTVLEGHSPCHPTKREDIRIGTNPIGASTCGPTFTGRIISVTRRPRPQD